MSFDMSMIPAQVRDLDAILRCPICDGYFSNAVSFAECSHTFCSVCIKRSLLFKNECPLCRHERTDVVYNRILDDIVENYTKSKNEMKKNMAEPTQESIKSVFDAKNGTEYVSDSDEDDFQDEASVCPVCSLKIRSHFMDKHKEECIGDMSSRSNLAAKRMNKQMFEMRNVAKEDPLPMLCYHIMKDKEIRDNLAKLSLPTTGSRKEMINMHREFVLLFNSQLSSMHPMTKEECLLKFLKREKQTDKLRGQRKIDILKRQVQIKPTKPVKKDAKKEKARPSSSFKSLIEEIKGRGNVKKKKIESSATSDGSKKDAKSMTESEVEVKKESREAKGNVTKTTWRVVFSERMKMPFYYNEATKIGQFNPPPFITGRNSLLPASKKQRTIKDFFIGGREEGISDSEGE